MAKITFRLLINEGIYEGSDGISQELISIVKGLWERLKTEADQKIAQHQQETNRIIDEARQALIQEQKRNADLQTQIRHWEEQLHQEKHLSATLHQSLEEEKRSNAKLVERNYRVIQQLHDQKSETERLHQLLSHVQNNLEHYQASIQKLHEEQVLSTEKQKAMYEREINLLKQNLIEEEREKNQLIYLKREIDKSQEENSSLKKQLHEKIVSESKFQQQCIQLDQSSSHYQNKVEEQSKVIIDLEMKLAVISSQLSSLQLSHDKANDTIRILRDEKLFLVQEKSQIEGQLKRVDISGAKKHREANTI